MIFDPSTEFASVLSSGMTDIITSSREVMSGTPVFSGTRVPVQTLIEYLESGDSIDDFLEGFPTVSREQVIAFLESVRAQVIRPRAA
jgi:uncharacterized protein (DUF433 family)